MEGLSRLFVAVPLTDQARHALSATLLRAAPAGMPGRVVHPANWHVTLRFLGDVDAIARDRVSAALDEAGLGPPFSVLWGRFGAFPRPENASVLWVGADRGADHLEHLAAEVDAAAQGAGFQAEDRPFRPHLTLSRIRPHRDVGPLLATGSLGVHMEVGRIVLYQSHLGKGGVRYEEIEEFPLG